MDILRTLFAKYAKKGKQLNKIIKMDCTINFNKVGILEQVGVIKIIKCEVVDNNPESHNYKKQFFRNETLQHKTISRVDEAKSIRNFKIAPNAQYAKAIHVPKMQ